MDGASECVYTVDEVSKHNTEESAWIIIEGFVHDITGFLYEHPGGKDIMMDHLGKDASTIFVLEDEHVHSMTAFTMLARYRIGTLSGTPTVVDRLQQQEEHRTQLAKLVDVTKPILPQIPALGRNYNPWLHTQFGLKSIIIFDDFREALSRYPWWYIFIMWIPFVIFAVTTSLRAAGLATTITKFGMGVMFWTLLEYVLHRFVFHMHTETPFWNTFHFFAHGIHHLTPNDSTRLTFPPMFSAFLGLLVYQVTSLVPHASGIHGFLAGLAFMFMSYDAIHYYFHHGDAPWLPDFLKRMKTAHLNHHYKNDNINFGVTTQIMDLLFGTL